MPDNETKTTETEVKETETKTYTQEEVDALLQKEGDKRVQQALKTAERKKEAAVKEAQKLAQMNEEEKYRYELEQREAAIAEKEKQMALLENKNEAMNVLASRGISTVLADFVVTEDAETMMENIRLLEDEFKKSVRAEVEKRLSSKSPKLNLGSDEGMTRDDWNKLSLQRQTQLLNESPKVYEKFL